MTASPFGFGGMVTRPRPPPCDVWFSMNCWYMRALIEADDVHVEPHRVELLLLRLVEDQLVERLIVAEIAHQAVEAGVEIAAAILASRSK